ncbi:MAG: putative metal-binding motif-containing protein [Pseudomonadota bacterium]|nr:putative metal-binding motif-containing protein [Pseudomonadota bacterium]
MLLFLACTGPPHETDRPVKETAGDTDPDSGVDTDTAPPPVDNDGDGYAALASGGDDCDDDHPRVHPGATEMCDPIDQDCDGEPIPAGSCAGVQDIEAIAVPLTWQDDGGEAAIVGDVTGDGLADVLYSSFWDTMTSPADGQPNGAHALYVGGEFPDAVECFPEGAAQVWAQDQTRVDWPAREVVDVGDVNGDGFRDVGVVQTLGANGIYLHHGPFALGGAMELARDADAVWTSQLYDVGGGWGIPTTDGTDLDGDGMDEVAVGVYSLEEATAIAFELFRGGGDKTEADVTVYGDIGTNRHLKWLGDLDGDGIQELLMVSAAREMGWISGAEIPLADGAHWTDLVLGQLREPSADCEPCYADPTSDWQNVGDWDGDGIDEIAAAANDDDTIADSSGQVWIFGGEQAGLFTVEDAKGSWVGERERDDLGAVLRACDIDGDGRMEKIVYLDRDPFPDDEETGAGQFVVVSGEEPLPPLRSFLPERTWRFSYTSYLSPCSRDTTGDGRADFAMTAFDADYIGVLPGWEIPWDDDSKW